MITKQLITAEYPIAHFYACDLFIDAVMLHDNNKQFKDIINETQYSS